jgi:hypothetical protein
LAIIWLLALTDLLGVVMIIVKMAAGKSCAHKKRKPEGKITRWRFL